jgi:hypothetical protein
MCAINNTEFFSVYGFFAHLFMNQKNESLHPPHQIGQIEMLARWMRFIFRTPNWKIIVDVIFFLLFTANMATDCNLCACISI